MAIANKDLVYDVLLQLSSDGKLTPFNAVEVARDPASPLHHCFLWDDSVAAEKYRQQQARDLIGSFQITQTIKKTEYKVQEFVRDPRRAGDEQGYARITEIKTNGDLRRDFMLQELVTAKGHVQRTKAFASILGFGKEVTQLETQIETLLEQVSA